MFGILTVHYDMPSQSRNATNDGEKFDAQYFNITSLKAHIT